MKKTLLTALLGMSLIGTSQLKAQDDWKFEDDYAYAIQSNHSDKDSFVEEFIGGMLYGVNKEKTEYFGGIVITYIDMDNDNFYESIELLNTKSFDNSTHQTITEKFYIDNNTKFVDYEFKEYFCSQDLWNKTYGSKPFNQFLVDDNHENLPLKKEISKSYLKGEEMEKLDKEYGMDIKNRFLRLMSSSKDDVSLKAMLKAERNYWQAKD